MAKAALAAGEDELIPADFANRLLDGESGLRVYRVHGSRRLMGQHRKSARIFTSAKIHIDRVFPMME